MIEETEVAPDVATINPAPEAIETPEVVAPDTEGQEPPEDEKPQLSDAEKEVKALKRRIDRMTQQKYQTAAENDHLRRQPAEQPDQQGNYTAAQVNAYVNTEANKRAATIARDQAADQKLQAVEAALRKSAGASYNDFYEDLASAGPAAGVFLNTVMEMDDAAKVLTHFVTDREALDQVLRMTPLKQAAHMGQLSARLEAGKSNVSTAPKPLTPLTSRSASRPSSSGSGDEDLVRQIRASR